MGEVCHGGNLIEETEKTGIGDQGMVRQGEGLNEAKDILDRIQHPNGANVEIKSFGKLKLSTIIQQLNPGLISSQEANKGFKSKDYL